VLDFGISKVLDSAAEALTRTGMIVGTPGYMSPEQASGQTVDVRTDVYGAGAILYRAVTGRAAFAGRDTTLVLSAVLTEEPSRPRSVEPSIPDALELVIQRAMAKAADDRYQTMQDLALALLPFDEALVSSGNDAETPAVSEVRILGQGSDASITTALTQTTLQTSELVRGARPSIVLFSLAGYLWFLGCAVDAMTAVLSAGKPLDERAATTRLVGAVAAVAVVLLGPLVLWIRHVARNWTSSHAAIELAAATRRVTFSAIVSYAALVLALRLLMATTGLSGLDSNTPRVSLSLLLVTVAGAVGAFLNYRRQRRKRTGA
jgi:hypothetical protein